MLGFLTYDFWLMLLFYLLKALKISRSKWALTPIFTCHIPYTSMLCHILYTYTAILYTRFHIPLITYIFSYIHIIPYFLYIILYTPIYHFLYNTYPLYIYHTHTPDFNLYLPFLSLDFIKTFSLLFFFVIQMKYINTFSFN